MTEIGRHIDGGFILDSRIRTKGETLGSYGVGEDGKQKALQAAKAHAGSELVYETPGGEWKAIEITDTRTCLQPKGPLKKTDSADIQLNKETVYDELFAANAIVSFVDGGEAQVLTETKGKKLDAFDMDHTINQMNEYLDSGYITKAQEKMVELRDQGDATCVNELLAAATATRRSGNYTTMEKSLAVATDLTLNNDPARSFEVSKKITSQVGSLMNSGYITIGEDLFKFVDALSVNLDHDQKQIIANDLALISDRLQEKGSITAAEDVTKFMKEIKK